MARPARLPRRELAAITEDALPSSPPLSIDEVGRISRARLGRLVGEDGAVQRGLRELYSQALEELLGHMETVRRRARRGRTPFSQTQAHSVRSQLEDGIRQLTDMLGAYVAQAQRDAAVSGVQDLVREVRSLERYYHGVAAPLSIEQASVFAGLVQEQQQQSVLRQYPGSVQAYGMGLIRHWEGYLARATLAKIPFETVVNRVTAAAARPGLLSESNYGAPTFERWRGARIVRTETMHAYNGVRQRGLERLRANDFPDMKKIARATFDLRTAPDSYPVHNQVRALEEPFEDGAGRRYLHPPGRPNDREVELPWRDAWDTSMDLDEAPELASEGEESLSAPEERAEAERSDPGSSASRGASREGDAARPFAVGRLTPELAERRRQASGDLLEKILEMGYDLDSSPKAEMILDRMERRHKGAVAAALLEDRMACRPEHADNPRVLAEEYRHALQRLHPDYSRMSGEEKEIDARLYVLANARYLGLTNLEIKLTKKQIRRIRRVGY